VTTLGWLRFDRSIGLGAHRVGLVMMIGALVGGALYLAKNADGPQRSDVD